MRLNRLELQGYKTFATRTEFVFESGITAVVGPNGSGKSNIADAIRWVLGEQSYSLLRGKKTEDMIFAGSQKRARAGMAQANILLDNGDGKLPVDFSEVAIGRRAYRSGENEYLLNGNRVRLRDTAELLSASGLGQRTYNVIGQGLVDAVLSLRAEERRALFEEAAGIALYKERREDALRKLEATRRNVERVTDILNEIEPRMRRLEKEAGRSREYEQVRRDLENLLYTWYGYHWEFGKRQLRAAREQAQAQRATLETIRSEQITLEERLTLLRREAGDLRGKLGTWHRQNSQLHSQAEELQRSLAVRAERLRMLDQRHEELDTETESLCQQQERAIDQVSQAQELYEQTNARVQEQEEIVSQLRARIDDYRARLQELQETERAAQSEQVRLDERLAQLENQRQDLQRRHVELAAEQETEAETLAQQRTDKAAADDELSRCQGELDAVTDALGTLDQERSALREERQAAQTRLRELADSGHRARSELVGLEARRQARAAVRTQAAGYDTAVQQILASPNRPAGVVGPAGQLLRVPAEHDGAVAAALGADLSALVVTTWEAAREIMVLAEQDDIAGELRLLPLDLLRPAKPITAPDDPDVVGIASELVTCERAHQAVIHVLLGQTLVVRSSEAARRLAGRLPRGAMVVTPDGIVLTQDGRLRRAGDEPRARLLAQERQWHSLPEEIDRASTVAEEAESALAEGRNSLDQVEARLDAASARIQELQSSQQAASRARERAALAVDRLAQNIAWHVERIRTMEAQAAELAAELARLASARQELEEQQADLRSRLQDLGRELTSASEPLDELANQLAGQERTLAHAQGLRQNHQALVDTHRNAAAQIGAQITARHRRIEAIEEERADLLAERAHEREDKRELAERIRAIGDLISPTEADLARVEGELERLFDEEHRLRRRVRNTEQGANRAQLGLERQEAQLEHLRERIEEELGLVDLPLNGDIAGQTPLPLGEIVGHLPVVLELPADLDSSIQRRKQQLKRMGPVNPNAPAEFVELSERNSFLRGQLDDLHEADTKLRQVITELDEVMKREFEETFAAVAEEFKSIFSRLFGGGSARLILTDPDDPIQSGVEIIARPPGRRQQGLALLSGGERSLTAAALIFSLLKISPTPFCVLDEVDAMLDEANVSRFRDLLVELSERTQFIVITHNRGTVQVADTIYGISMGDDGASQVISLRLEGDELATVEIEKAPGS
jgi:chromosome segregation protein